MALINSLADPYFQNVLIANPNRAAAEANDDITMDNQLGIVRDPATLAQCIQGEKWPKKHRYCGFTNRRNLMELRLTAHHIENDPKKLHCALCVSGKTMFGCKVALCKTSKDKLHKHQSCFMIWPNHIDLVIEHHKIRQAYRGS